MAQGWAVGSLEPSAYPTRARARRRRRPRAWPHGAERPAPGMAPRSPGRQGHPRAGVGVLQCPAHSAGRRESEDGGIGSFNHGHLNQPALARGNELALSDQVTDHDEQDNPERRSRRPPPTVADTSRKKLGGSSSNRLRRNRPPVQEPPGRQPERCALQEQVVA